MKDTAEPPALPEGGADHLGPPRTLEDALERLAQREQELQALRQAQQEWLHAVSHDLRAPLRHVLSFGPLVDELLGQAAPSPQELQEAREFLRTMDQSARRMGVMLDGLLALARAARTPLQWQPVALGELLQQAREAVLARPQWAALEREVQWRMPPQLPVVRADASLLRQVLAELMDNSLKFTRNTAQPSIAIEVEHGADGGIELSISDNGAGFDPSRAGTLFGIFQRMHRESEFPGLGLGLALVRSVTRRHGGDVSIHGMPGAGCSVRLRWPGAAPRRP
ncbi:sensor histidine kinase [Delftia sp. PS-11]|uniref:sensor histidine kinase n=1 Tax=Delftia sp. PS-11 TaxID=2767222 RepID=UPI002457811B|nr:ATP-binding protein [Delftia sp. PS-11]KAJ8744510.1 sensor histidine kinase [Delftia sp. PS-11]